MIILVITPFLFNVKRDVGIHALSRRALPERGLLSTPETTDYYTACSGSNANVPSSVMGNMFAADGTVYTGIILPQLSDTIEFESKMEGRNLFTGVKSLLWKR